MVLFTAPSVVDMSVWIYYRGWGHPIPIRVWRIGTISLAVINSATISDSAAEDITDLMIWSRVRTAPFHFGWGSSSAINMWSPVQLRDLYSLWNSVSAWAATIMLLDQKLMPLLG